MEELTPTDIAQRRFATAFRGYDTAEVRAFLNRVSKHVALVNDRYGDLLARAGAPASSGAVRVGPSTSVPTVGTGSGDVVVLRSGTRPDAAPALITLPEGAGSEPLSRSDAAPSGETDEAALGGHSDAHDAQRNAGPSTHAEVLAAARREGATLVDAAQREAAEIVTRANEEAARIILRARAESRGSSREPRTGDDAVSVEAARAEARAMIEEARALRERVLTDLAKRRRTAHVQLEQLRGAREKLSESLREARRLVDDAHRNLSTADAEARLAGDAAARRLASEPLATVAELDAEVSATRHLLRGGVLPFATDRAGADAHPGDDDDTSPSLDRGASARLDDATAPDGAASVDDIADGANTTSPRAASEDGDASDTPVAADTTGGEVGAARPWAEVGAQARAQVGAEAEGAVAPEAVREVKPEAGATSVDALFARLRAEAGPDAEPVAKPVAESGADIVAETATQPEPTDESDAGPADAPVAPVAPVAPDALDAATPEPAAAVSPSEAAAATAATVAHTTNASDADTAVRSAAAFAAWDRVLAARGPDAARSLKRAMQDELSTILSSLRSASGRPDADLVLGSAAVRMELFGDAVRPAIAAGWAAGRISVGDAASEQGEHPVVARLVEDAARWLVDELTAPVEAALATIDDAETEHGKLAELLGVHYRSWRVDRAGGIAEDLMHRAFCEATIESVGTGATLRWVGRANVSPCAPDCEDNRLCDGVTAGEPFPSGHRAPPAADACRSCLLVAVR